MKNSLKTIVSVAVISMGLVGCTAINLTAHTAVIDHQGSGIPAGRSGRRDDGDFWRPASDHVSLKGDASRGLLEKGKGHFRDQNYGLAEESFRKAVEVSSDNANAWLGLAASLDQLGRFDFADRAYNQLVKLKQNNARVYNNMGYSFLLRGDYSRARKYFNRAQSIDPSLEEIQGNIHLLEKTVNV